MALQVVGAGWARTGTTSLQRALSVLGCGPVYHMFELFLHLDHLPAWEVALDGGSPDWDALLAGYGAAVDWPAALCWRELADRYPDARVLLSVRDPDRWFSSFEQTVLAARQRMTVPPGPLGDALRFVGRCLDRAVGPGEDTRAACIAAYQRHNAAVQAAFDDHRLLVYDVAQGWEPLCRWLGVPVPAEPFPLLNTRQEFRSTLALDAPLPTS